MDQINSKLKEINNNINKILDVMLKKDNTNTQKDELKKRRDLTWEQWKKNSDEYQQLLYGESTSETNKKLDELRKIKELYWEHFWNLNNRIENFE
ncbi:hypothetical protein M9Y10_024826 [Tritrichomonas musculus]|uniref:Uncharacterized protein n=1 Tax=Tritrichomonas musculus TaxID=1915356 RepID=A0ABR2HBC4_9EUKA